MFVSACVVAIGRKAKYSLKELYNLKILYTLILLELWLLFTLFPQKEGRVKMRLFQKVTNLLKENWFRNGIPLRAAMSKVWNNPD